MIFVQALHEAGLFLMLTEQDVNNMRGGRTVFADLVNHGAAAPVGKIVLSLHPSNEAALDTVRKAGYKVAGTLDEPSPEAGQGRCQGCRGIMAEALLLAGKCVACWRESAEHYRLEYLQLAKAQGDGQGERADWFLDLHGRWFGDPTNDLYGLRAECRRALVGYLMTGEAPPEGTPEGYVVLKWRREVEGS